MLKKIVIFFLIRIYSVLNAAESAENNLNVFFNDFIFKYNIKCPLNFEYSIKVTKNDVYFNRYLAALPTRCININDSQQMNDLLSFIPIKAVKDKIEDQIKNKQTGSIGYAADFFHNKKRYRAYLSFPSCSADLLFISYEWFEGEEKYYERSYKYIENYQVVLEKLINKKDLKTFEKLKYYLFSKKVHLRSGEDEKQVLYFSFKQIIDIQRIKKLICNLVHSFNQSNDFSQALEDLNGKEIVWLSIGKEEITIYYRTNEWIFQIN